MQRPRPPPNIVTRRPLWFDHAAHPTRGNPMKKRFAKMAGDIRPLACGLGGCLATDMITVDGMPVRFMYRERPDNDLDSGWRFFAGGETDEYIDNPANSGAMTSIRSRTTIPISFLILKRLRDQRSNGTTPTNRSSKSSISRLASSSTTAIGTYQSSARR